MNDPRYDQLASVIVGYSTELQPGEKVLIDAHETPPDMVVALIRRVVAAGAIPFVETHQAAVRRALFHAISEAQLDTLVRRDLAFMQEMQAYITLRGSHNVTEMSDVPQDRMRLVQEKLKPVMDWRVDHTKWCVLRWPTPAMAQLAGMSTEAFENFYFRVCTLDYANMERAQYLLRDRLQAADRVHIKGPGETDLSFSIKGIGVKLCCGKRNLPDGEVFTAPVRDSVNGVIAYNTGTLYNGIPFDNVRLVFKAGKIVEATSSNTAALNAILDTDEGARYVGEFAFGLNPHIHRAMRDILFDEKIAGSIHFTPGETYKETDNGNHSKIHWDLVLIQTPELGGGEIALDGVVIRKDGRFLPVDLQGLNPEALAEGGGQKRE